MGMYKMGNTRRIAGFHHGGMEHNERGHTI